MSLTINTKTFTQDSFSSDKVGYRGPNQTVTLSDKLALSRTAPKRTIEFSGVGRVGAKLTRTLALTGAATPQHDAIGDVNVSVPVGFNPTDVDNFLDDLGAYVSSASFKAQVKAQQIAF